MLYVQKMICMDTYIKALISIIVLLILGGEDVYKKVNTNQNFVEREEKVLMELGLKRNESYVMENPQ